MWAEKNAARPRMSESKRRSRCLTSAELAEVARCGLGVAGGSAPLLVPEDEGAGDSQEQLDSAVFAASTASESIRMQRSLAASSSRPTSFASRQHGRGACGLRAVGSTTPARPEPPSRDSALQATHLRREHCGRWWAPPAGSTAYAAGGAGAAGVWMQCATNKGMERRLSIPLSTI